MTFSKGFAGPVLSTRVLRGWQTLCSVGWGNQRRKMYNNVFTIAVQHLSAAESIKTGQGQQFSGKNVDTSYCITLYTVKTKWTEKPESNKMCIWKCWLHSVTCILLLELVKDAIRKVVTKGVNHQIWLYKVWFINKYAVHIHALTTVNTLHFGFALCLF